MDVWAGMDVCDENGTGMLAARKAGRRQERSYTIRVLHFHFIVFYFLIEVLADSLPSTPLPIFAPPMTPGTCHHTPST